MATLTHEYYHKTGEFIVHVDDGERVDSATNDDGVKFSLVKSRSTGLMWIEVNGRAGMSAISPRNNITNEWFRRWIDGTAV